MASGKQHVDWEAFRKACDGVVERIRAAASLEDVWDMAPHAAQAACPSRGGVVKSPFRADKKGASFSVTRDCRRFCGHGSDEGQKGDIFSFVALCKGLNIQADFQEVAKLTALALRMDWPEAQDFPLSGPAKTPQGESKTAFKDRMRDLERKRQEATRKRLLQAAELPEPLDATKLPLAPSCVMSRWDAGRAMARLQSKVIADWRGWPHAWAEALAECVQLSCPTDVFDSRSFIAFPVMTPTGKFVGYHQRWRTKDGKRGWTYFPHAPRWLENQDRSRSRQSLAFAHAMLAWSKQAEGYRVPCLPFFLGDVDGATCAVIFEGQWDAITFWGAIGGFEDSFDLPICVLGMRGNESVAAFFSYWSTWIPGKRLMIVADSDAAGGKWLGTTGNYAVPDMPGLPELCRTAGAEAATLHYFQQQDGGPSKIKDFNDWFRAAYAADVARANDGCPDLPAWRTGLLLWARNGLGI